MPEAFGCFPNELKIWVFPGKLSFKVFPQEILAVRQ